MSVLKWSKFIKSIFRGNAVLSAIQYAL